jgi:hypothetical protein
MQVVCSTFNVLGTVLFEMMQSTSVLNWNQVVLLVVRCRGLERIVPVNVHHK